MFLGVRGTQAGKLILFVLVWKSAQTSLLMSVERVPYPPCGMNCYNQGNKSTDSGSQEPLDTEQTGDLGNGVKEVLNPAEQGGGRGWRIL